MRGKYRFDIDKTISYWLESAKYDLGVVHAMLKTKKYPYALFMGHLALEKIPKALVVKKTRTHAPFSHSLPYLLERSGIKMPEPMQVRLSEFMEFHIEARYPDASRVFYKRCTKGYTKQGLRKSKRYLNG